MAALLGSSTKNETRFDRALSLINRADFFAIFLKDVRKIGRVMVDISTDYRQISRSI